MIQSTPAQGGIVSPEPGVHSQQFGSEMVLTATPRSGYSFVYWIGDVKNPTTSRTTASMNSPKIIIAVFERNSYENLQPSEIITKNPGGGLIPSPRQRTTTSSRAVVVPDEPDQPTYDNDNEIPVPEEPEPIPEPATGLILAAGSWIAIRRKWKTKQIK
jgi:hypothetical protein